MRSLCAILLGVQLPAMLFSTATAFDQPQQGKPLPRLLIIGDSTYEQHTRDLQKVLKGQVEVTYAFWNHDEIADTATTLKLLDRHLGRIDRNGQPVEQEKWPRWDVIHWNCGLADLVHRAPGVRAFRVMPIHAGGVCNTTADQYARNLDTLVTQLQAKAPSAKLIWASTTPIRASATQVFRLGSEVEYNAIAAQVMQRHGVAINDMYDFVKHLINMDKPAGFGADPFNFDKKPIHMPIVRILEQTLSLSPAEESEEEKISREKRQQVEAGS